MKNPKRGIALLLAAVLCLSPAGAAWASEEVTGQIPWHEHRHKIERGVGSRAFDGGTTLSADKDAEREIEEADTVIEKLIPAPALGDADRDGDADAADVTALLRYVDGELPDTYPYPNADMDGNGYLDRADAALLLRHIVGLP